MKYALGSTILILVLVVAGYFAYPYLMNHGSSHADAIKGEETFLLHMIPHHQEAIDTSKIVLASTQDEILRRLTSNIISAQEGEISIMEGTLISKYPEAQPIIYKAMMDTNLANYTGEELEKAYLEGMILHHEGAIAMAEKMKNHEMEASTQVIVTNIIATQQAEIDEMKLLLQNY
ncbi:MAG: DUF305 domain-containing protein [Candidatus Absconditabacteria bacterium]|nr:DUF305 domain-containing protein [Candidatus Absconditabacteria bacterium]MDD3868056.1 DUF305 domain-containing protein [Candidatus Absconditabacteria bacterium]MDD4714303.1 DUF305 domain-containing protein [Candidatus Absconditabacteria bacterium]